MRKKHLMCSIRIFGEKMTLIINLLRPCKYKLINFNLNVFIHLPFSKEICHFFTCNKSIFHILVENTKSIIFFTLLKYKGNYYYLQIKWNSLSTNNKCISEIWVLVLLNSVSEMLTNKKLQTLMIFHLLMMMIPQN